MVSTVTSWVYNPWDRVVEGDKDDPPVDVFGVSLGPPQGPLVLRRGVLSPEVHLVFCLTGDPGPVGAPPDDPNPISFVATEPPVKESFSPRTRACGRRVS